MDHLLFHKGDDNLYHQGITHLGSKIQSMRNSKVEELDELVFCITEVPLHCDLKPQ